MPRLRMRDFWTFKPKEIMENKRYLFECKDSTSSTGSSLLVKVAATHSGVVNSNHRFYRPDRMQDAAHQWVAEEGKGYAKPVLVEHDRHGDVLGRVRTARYIDESYKWAGDFPTIKDSIFYRVGDSKIDLFKSVDWIVDNLMVLPDYSGLGYIELGLNVTNPVGIEKILRDEYLTVSVGFQTGSAICSICHQDWAQDDKCEHRPGMDDEESGRPAFLICGDFNYEELSFVNFPADPFAGKIAKDALKDSLSRKFFMGLSHDKQQAFVAAAGMSMSDAVMDYDVQIVEEKVATVYDLNKVELQNAFEAEVKVDSLTAARALELKQNLSEWKPEAEDAKVRKRSLTSTLNAKIRKNGWTGVTTSVIVTDEEKEIQAAISTDSEACGCGGKDKDDCQCETDWSTVQLTADEQAFFDDEEGLYSEMIIEMDAALAAGELTDAQLKDAKLSTEQRKKMAGGTFCGPNRSFPVPDCAHVTAARRLIGRAKVGDSTKSKILACVSRKAASLGCGGATKKDEVAKLVVENSDTNKSQDSTIQKFVDEAQMGDYSKDVLGNYDSLHKIYHKADDALKGRMRNLHYAIGQHWDSAASLEYAKQYVKEYAKDSVLIASKDLAEKEEAVNRLTDENASLKIAVANVDATKATAVEMLKAVKRSLATQIVMYKTLTGHADFKGLDQAAINVKVDELSKRHVTSLKDAVADLMSELKWAEPVVAKSTDKAITEPGKSIPDNVQIKEPVAAADKTATETEAEKLQKQLAADAAVRDRLAFMTPRERVVYMADLAFNDARAVKN